MFLQVYVPTNTLNRLSDKRIDNNMVLIDYEDVSMDPRNRGPASAYGPSSPYPRVTQQGVTDALFVYTKTHHLPVEWTCTVRELCTDESIRRSRSV